MILFFNVFIITGCIVYSFYFYLRNTKNECRRCTHLKTMSRFLPRLVRISYHKQNASYLLCHYRTILNYATTSTSTTDNDNNSMEDAKPIKLSTHYPPLPIEERSKQKQKPSGQKIEPYKDVQFKPESKKQPKSGQIPNNLDDDNITDKQTNRPSTPGI